MAIPQEHLPATTGRTASVEMLRPLVAVDEAVRAFNEYQKLKQKLRTAGDFVKFKVRRKDPETGQWVEEEKETPTKQWRSKLTRFFGISCEIISETMEYLPDGSFIVRVTARAVAPNGLSMVGDGACHSKTKEKYDREGNLVGDLYHNTRSHAITRAKNRAVLELVGFGEVSAEEIEEDDGSVPVPTPAAKPGIPKPVKGSAKPRTEPAGGEPNWTRFWATVRDMGLTKDEIHRIAGVDSLVGWSQADLDKLLVKAAEEMRRDQDQR